MPLKLLGFMSIYNVYGRIRCIVVLVCSSLFFTLLRTDTQLLCEFYVPVTCAALSYIELTQKDILSFPSVFQETTFKSSKLICVFLFVNVENTESPPIQSMKCEAKTSVQ